MGPGLVPYLTGIDRQRPRSLKFVLQRPGAALRINVQRRPGLCISMPAGWKEQGTEISPGRCSLGINFGAEGPLAITNSRIAVRQTETRTA
jgi:hypothetical protein